MSAEARQRARAWIGGAVILLVVAVAAVVFMLDAIVARLRPTYHVVAVLAEAPRLTRGSRVWVSGRDVGQVRTIRFLPIGNDTVPAIAAVLELPTSVREHVRRDSRIRVTSERMIGEPVLDIIPGTLASPRLAAGDTLHQERGPDAGAVMARAAAVGAALDTALGALRALRPPLERRLEAYGRVQAQLARAQQEYRMLAEDVRRSPALALLGEGGVQTSLERSRVTLRQLLEALGQAGERAEESGALANAQAAAASAARLQRSLAQLETAMRAGGTMDRLLRDSALVRALAAARAELDSLVADAKRRPLRYVF